MDCVSGSQLKWTPQLAALAVTLTVGACATMYYAWRRRQSGGVGIIDGGESLPVHADVFDEEAKSEGKVLHSFRGIWEYRCVCLFLRHFRPTKSTFLPLLMRRSPSSVSHVWSRVCSLWAYVSSRPITIGRYRCLK